MSLRYHRLSRLKGLLFLCFLLLHLLKSMYLYPSLSDIWGPEPVYDDDHALMFYYGLIGSKFLSHYGATWGYDPFFMAGYPKSPVYHPSSQLIEFIIYIFFFIPPAIVYNIYILFIINIIPFLLFFSFKNFGLNYFWSMIGAALETSYFWLRFPLTFILIGASTFPLAVYLSLFVFSLAYRYTTHQDIKTGLFMGIIAPILPFTHIISPIILIIPLIVLYLISFKSLSRASHIFLWLCLLWVLFLNIFWLKPFFLFYPYKTSSAQFIQSWSVFHLSSIAGWLKPFLKVIWGIIWLLLGMIGLYQWKKSGEKPKVYSFLALCLFLYLLTTYGKYWNFTATFQPGRFILPLHVFFLVPAVYGIFWLTNSILSRHVKPRLLFAAFAGLIILSQIFIPSLSWFPFNRGMLHTHLDMGIVRLIEWIKESTNSEGRILLEDSNEQDTEGKGHQYDGSHLPALLPLYTNRQFIGGPEPNAFLQHHFAQFHDGVLCSRKLENFSLGELQEYLDLYNIKWIICWSQKAKVYFKQFPEYITKIRQVDKFSIYIVNRALSYFHRGRGDIWADYNQLKLRNLTPEAGMIIIKYHWMERLKTDPPRPLERVYLKDDPIGFIKIINPPQSLLIYTNY